MTEGEKIIADGLHPGVTTPAICGEEPHGDPGGEAVAWGITHRATSAADCCEKCTAHAQLNPKKPCNSWSFCYLPVCWGLDNAHNHTFGECWLKHEPDIASPIAAGPTLPRAMREAPRRQWPWAVSEKLWAGLPPERLQWQSGIVAPRDANVWTNVRLPGWHKGWCKRHGSCNEGEMRR